MNMRTSFLAPLLLASISAAAQDPAAVDPQHFKIEYEDQDIRIVRFVLPPGEKTPVHDRAERVTVVLSNARVKVSYPDRPSNETAGGFGKAHRRSAMKLMVENISNEPYETVTVEFKKAGAQGEPKSPK